MASTKFFLWKVYIFILIFFQCQSIKHSMNGTVYYNANTNDYNIKLNIIDCENGIVCGYFNDTLNETGWGILEIKTNNNTNNNYYSDEQKMYSAGLLEGYLSSYEIVTHFENLWDAYKEIFGTLEVQLTNWTNIQRQWINEQIDIYTNNNNNNNNNMTLYWTYVNLLMKQFDGMLSGYNEASKIYNLSSLSEYNFQLLVAGEDLLSVVMSIAPHLRIPWDKLTLNEILNIQSRTGHCSSIIKVTPQIDDIFIAHSTWNEYNFMNRIYKHYIFYLNLNMPTTHLAMSSYPGALSSIDDFYIMDSGLAVTETTNNIFNTSLWDLLIPQSLFTWQRIRISTALTNNGPDFVNTFSQYNSGTYNNQWMILNYGIFQPYQPLPNNLLTIVEQIPMKTASKDVTDILERGYWSSYNVPAIKQIYDESGYDMIVKLKGTTLSYDLAPRARIFRRDGNKYNNITSLQTLMRYNNYNQDIIENNDPMWAIMSRGDLQEDPTCTGGIDTKISNLDMLKSRISYSKAGPTNDNVPTFTFDGKTELACTNMGLPKTFNFDWETMKSQLI